MMNGGEVLGIAKISKILPYLGKTPANLLEQSFLCNTLSISFSNFIVILSWSSIFHCYFMIDYYLSRLKTSLHCSSSLSLKFSSYKCIQISRLNKTQTSNRTVTVMYLCHYCLSACQVYWFVLSSNYCQNRMFRGSG